MSKEQSMSLQSLEHAVPIVRTRLDDELEMQPEYYWHAAKGLAFALSRRDEASRQLKETDAEVYREFNTPGADGKLPSDAKILRELELDKRHQAAARQVSTMSHEVNLWTGMVETFNKRNSMLGRLAELMVSGIIQRDSAGSPRSQVDADRETLAKRRQAAYSGTGAPTPAPAPAATPAPRRSLIS